MASRPSPPPGVFPENDAHHAMESRHRTELVIGETDPRVQGAQQARLRHDDWTRSERKRIIQRPRREIGKIGNDLELFHEGKYITLKFPESAFLAIGGRIREKVVVEIGQAHNAIPGVKKDPRSLAVPFDAIKLLGAQQGGRNAGIFPAVLQEALEVFLRTHERELALRTPDSPSRGSRPCEAHARAGCARWQEASPGTGYRRQDCRIWANVRPGRVGPGRG